jgi:hypothetical protein
MSRTFVVLLLVGLSIGVLSESAATQDRWLGIVGADGQIKVSVDTMRIVRTQAGVKAWVRYDFPQPIINSDVEVDRVVFLQEYDCSMIRTRMFSVYRYLRGVLVQTFSWPPQGGDWVDPAPDTIGEQALVGTCRLYFAERVSDNR